ncbi:hypothetical protein SASC598O11_000600, partial [Snodgrassella alvi SCGC AB-598-O11]
IISHEIVIGFINNINAFITLFYINFKQVPATLTFTSFPKSISIVK